MADLGKLTWRKRKRLISQGRCFRCHQKGHHSNECKHSWGSRLAQLPVELLHEICLYLVYPNGKPPWDIPWTFEMKALRLTCREIDMKTYDFFTKIAFKSVAVYQSYEGLQTLSDISESRCASRIKQLVFFQHDRVMDNEEYEKLQNQIRTEDLNSRDRRQIMGRIRSAHREQTDKAFMESSTADGIMLTMALQKMPNLQTILISPTENEESRWSIRRAQSSTAPTTTHVFAMVLSSLALSGAKPHTLNLTWVSYGYGFQGVSIQALSMPRKMFQGVSELRELHLTLETNDTTYKNPDTWPFYLSTFLKHTPLLTQLSLSFFDKDWKDSEVIFNAVSTKVVLPNLDNLVLDAGRFAGVDLQLFLKKHNRLQSLELNNMDITGSVSFADILGELGSFDKLKRFNSRQIAQNGFRTAFRTLGKIEFESSRYRYGKDELQFFKDFEWLNVFRYVSVAEEWEGVQRKIGDLRRDLIVTHRTHEPDFDIGGYIWGY